MVIKNSLNFSHIFIFSGLFLYSEILTNIYFHVKNYLPIMSTSAFQNQITYVAKIFLETFYFWRNVDVTFYLFVYFVRYKAKKVT